MEQYATPAGIAAEVVFAALARGDIEGRSVLDAGCGNGILGIAAKLLGATRVLGVDMDPSAIDVARTNAQKLGVDLEWRAADIRDVREDFDTVLMNPPFGSQRRQADRPFLDTGVARGRVVYMFLNPKAEAFVRRRMEALGARVTDREAYEFPVPHTFAFHRAEVRRIPVLLFRLDVAKG
jgi:putative methylase